ELAEAGGRGQLVETGLPGPSGPPYPPDGGSLPPSLRSRGQSGGLRPPRRGRRDLPQQRADSGGRRQRGEPGSAGPSGPPYPPDGASLPPSLRSGGQRGPVPPAGLYLLAL